MIENIKFLYSQVNHKNKAIASVAEATGRKPNTVKTHWFTDASFWSIPEECQPKVVDVLQKIIRKQNLKTA